MKKQAIISKDFSLDLIACLHKICYTNKVLL